MQSRLNFNQGRSRGRGLQGRGRSCISASYIDKYIEIYMQKYKITNTINNEIKNHYKKLLYVHVYIVVVVYKVSVKFLYSNLRLHS